VWFAFGDAPGKRLVKAVNLIFIVSFLIDGASVQI
jgi:hypothetical protein